MFCLQMPTKSLGNAASKIIKSAVTQAHVIGIWDFHSVLLLLKHFSLLEMTYGRSSDSSGNYEAKCSLVQQSLLVAHRKTVHKNVSFKDFEFEISPAAWKIATGLATLSYKRWVLRSILHMQRLVMIVDFEAFSEFASQSQGKSLSARNRGTICKLCHIFNENWRSVDA